MSRVIFRPTPVGRGAHPEKNRFSAQVPQRPLWTLGVSANPPELKTHHGELNSLLWHRRPPCMLGWEVPRSSRTLTVEFPR